MNDPFAPAEQTAPADPWSEPDPANDTAVETGVDLPGTEVTVTLKQGGGHDAPWIVVRGVDPGHVKEQLRRIYETGLLEAVAKTAADFAKTGPARPTGATRPQAQPQQNTSGAGRTCPHGEMVFRSGTGAKGPWKGWFCPLPKGDPEQCRPIFTR